MTMNINAPLQQEESNVMPYSIKHQLFELIAIKSINSSGAQIVVNSLKIETA
jgi:hypothetical protein